MARLEELTRGASVSGLEPDRAVTVVDAQWIGTAAIELTYKDPSGKVSNMLLYREHEPSLKVEANGRAWSFDADGHLLRLVSEAQRIRLAHLFDPLLAVHSSDVEPLPHQITAVYEEMLPRQPLRYLLADDPGAGKTIMTGLFIKELLLRGDVQRCLIVCPGSLVEQWQDELNQKFDLPFDILTREKWEASRSGNWFAENDLAICRLDQLSRNEEIQAKLEQTDWDLVVCDEAHKMSASYFGSEVKYTQRYRLGQLLGRLTRHFLLLSATPHNGKEADFQLFMALLDGDRFEGKYRSSAHTTKADDLIRRLVKEQLLTFEGTKLFPERFAHTVPYKLTDAEAALYKNVTEYVREEFNRADALQNDGRKGTVGFALTVLQRRLASSPEAIYQSLKRRRERLEARSREEQLLKRGAEVQIDLLGELPTMTSDEIEEFDDAPDSEIEEREELVVDRATAASTIRELEAEIAILRRLEAHAHQVRLSGTDKKWEELSTLLHDRIGEIQPDQTRRKLVIFTEHRDTLRYLEERIRGMLGRPEAVVTIHGGMGREERRKAQEAFTQDKTVEILLATDAAGEGINLQRAHLMVNYDLPWNPNRIEQRFGRIHRIGQTEVCHLWNLVASETREGEVYHALLKKLDQEREALGGRVFDVLGKLTFGDNRTLRDLLMEAIRDGERPEVRARLTQVVEGALDREHLHTLLENRALYQDKLDVNKVRTLGEEMARADARRLQPHFISSFFLEAFTHLGGTIREREPKRYEVTRVPSLIRQRDRQIGIGAPVLERYERITFERPLRQMPGKPLAAFTAPGHPLLEATIDLILERYRGLLKQGGVLVDPAEEGEAIRALFYLDHKVQDGRLDRNGNRRVVSRQMQFVEIDAGGTPRDAGYAPYLDYRPISTEERALVEPALAADWLTAPLEARIVDFAVRELVPRHVREVTGRKEALVSKTMQAVHDRLTKEIIHWDHRAVELKQQEEAGKTPRMNSARAEQRAEELRGRLKRRTEELKRELMISALPPVVTGGLLVVPAGLLARLAGERDEAPDAVARETARIERIAMEAVMTRERAMGYEPRDVSAAKCGYDIESRTPGETGLRFIEVKGRVKGADTVTVTRNEILTGLNKPDDFILAIVEVDGELPTVHYVTRPFHAEPDFGATSVNYKIGALLARAEQLG